MSTYPETPKRKSTTGEKIQKGIAVAALGSVAAAGIGLVAHATQAENARNHRHNVALEKVIQPSAEKIAQYVMTRTTKPSAIVDGQYYYSIGTYADGKTTIDVEIRKVDGKAPSAADVTSAYIFDWKKPGSDQELGDSASYGLLLEGSTWTATEQVDVTKPYGDEGGLGYSTIQEPLDLRDFSEILDDAHVITRDTMERFQLYREASKR